MTFHHTSYGTFGRSLPVDLDGYVHTTIAGWMSARMDWGCERPTLAERKEWAREQAAEARLAIRDADAALAAWQQNN